MEIYPHFEEGLDGIVPGQIIIVLFWLLESTSDRLKVYPRGDRLKRLRGVFATRSPDGLNPLAISGLNVEAINGNRLEEVRGWMFSMAPQ